MKRIALLQPLPALVFDRGIASYSEFNSLGLAVLGGVLREAGHTVAAIAYPSNAKEIQVAVQEVDIVILGDFRYYAYFCNPLPLVRRTLETLASIEFSGTVLLAGRHTKFFPPELVNPTLNRSCTIRLCPTMGTLARALDLPTNLAAKLGNDSLPIPGYAPSDLLLANVLLGSVSRPASSSTGQLTVTAGCRYRCAFCEKAGTPMVRLPGEILRRQLSEFRETGVDYVIIWDEVFGQDELERSVVFDELRSAGMRFGCNTRVDLINELFVNQLASAGCKAVLFGVEIASWEEKERRTLGVDRGKTPGADTFRRVVELLSSRGIDPVGSVVIGLPEDTPEIIEARLNGCASLGFKHLYIRPLVPFPESALYQRAVKTGRIHEYATWSAEAWNTYPHGYPVLCAIEREELCRLARRPI